MFGAEAAACLVDETSAVWPQLDGLLAQPRQAPTTEQRAAADRAAGLCAAAAQFAQHLHGAAFGRCVVQPAAATEVRAGAQRVLGRAQAALAMPWKPHHG